MSGCWVPGNGNRGAERGTLNALFARPATGKSLLAPEIAVALVRAGYTAPYLDEENRITDLVDRRHESGGSGRRRVAGRLAYAWPDAQRYHGQNVKRR